MHGQRNIKSKYVYTKYSVISIPCVPQKQREWIIVRLCWHCQPIK